MKRIEAILAIIIVALVMTPAWFVYKKFNTKKNTETTTVTSDYSSPSIRKPYTASYDLVVSEITKNKDGDINNPCYCKFESTGDHKWGVDCDSVSVGDSVRVVMTFGK